jgi:NAD(P)-dependent dehydrogenase (short-subunit alcohol dehydrogenase family)
LRGGGPTQSRVAVWFDTASMDARDDFDVSGLRVLVTGSTRGLGEGVAEYLALCGAAVAVHGRDEERLKTVHDRLVAAGATVVAVRGDARDPEETEAFVDEAARGLGGLHGLVNNAGGTFQAAAADMSPNAFGAVLRENLTAPFTVAKAALPYLERSNGSIINIGSVSGTHATPGFAHYGAAKAGLINLTKTLAAEWGERGVRVNSVLPGLMATDGALESLFGNDPEKIEEAARKIGVGRLGRPDDLGAACRYLLSPAASFVHGSVLVLDGGPINVPAF